MHAYETLSEGINDLKKRGYTVDFNLSFDCIICHETPITLMPSEFEIVEVYRFEGATNPSDSSVLYAIESKHGDKGVLVNAYGVYSDPVSDEMVKKLVIHLHNN
ncbi:phosphoribosylpyrophosphate synthetase [Flavihumibacter fluvii]|uniref:phosphoribosylpyrophosphate synthetase n=1 Tax=Flavihumibacter fluvii TaxID=2838157 RepID=UPI001BDDDD25|nr:phosphoribosylpyrophosphate synthetase [Flavihumibacter fluvii]ULQ53737.1 phosphoribosylpyrophosphate synthetase [Flavihumibacter fluvii]